MREDDPSAAFAAEDDGLADGRRPALLVDLLQLVHLDLVVDRGRRDHLEMIIQGVSYSTSLL